MQKSKLINALRILQPDEIKQLLPFLQSPYFNRNSNVVKMYRVLLPHYPAFNARQLSRESVFKKIFPGKPYAHQQMLNLMSKFNALLEKYLIIRQLEQSQLQEEKLLLHAYAERSGCFDLFEKKVDRFHQSLDTLPFRDELYFLEKKELYLLYYGHPDTPLQKGDKGTLDLAIQNFADYKAMMDIKLKCAANARRNTIVDEQGKRKKVHPSDSEKHLLSLYEKLEKFQRDEAEIHYKDVLTQFKSTIHLLRKKDQRNIFFILINYCIRETNRGNADYFPIAFELNQLGLTHGCLLVHGKITETTFHNIVTASTSCRAFKWTKNFMDTYQHKLDIKVKADALALAYGFWYFEQKKYHQAIEVLQYSFREPIHAFKSKSLLIRSWFELWLSQETYFDLLLTQLESFEKYTRRDRALTSKLKTAFVKFILFTKKILNAARDKKLMKAIQSEIQREPNLVLKKWLLEKCEQQ
ncbi:MAG: hypothetical protein AAF985_17100 [Bacteroidota bacterium]